MMGICNVSVTQVKGGGHAYNVGFSSTTGVQISMAKFSEVSFDAESGTVTIGTGLTWDQVYSRLEPLGVMVAGGRGRSVGIFVMLPCFCSSMVYS